jgi:hypothetical protein
MRLMISRQAVRQAEPGRQGKNMFVDIKKADLTPMCGQEV